MTSYSERGEHILSLKMTPHIPGMHGTLGNRQERANFVREQMEILEPYLREILQEGNGSPS